MFGESLDGEYACPKTVAAAGTRTDKRNTAHDMEQDSRNEIFRVGETGERRDVEECKPGAGDVKDDGENEDWKVWKVDATCLRRTDRAPRDNEDDVGNDRHGHPAEGLCNCVSLQTVGLDGLESVFEFQALKAEVVIESGLFGRSEDVLQRELGRLSRALGARHVHPPLKGPLHTRSTAQFLRTSCRETPLEHSTK